LSLKPPWKQKNPIMEEACQAYHKQTAPAETVELIENMEVKTKGRPITKEIVYTTEYRGFHVTFVLFKSKGDVALGGKIVQREDRIDVSLCKYWYTKKVVLRYKGREEVFPRKSHEWVHFRVSK